MSDDTQKAKFGDGRTPWTGLPHVWPAVGAPWIVGPEEGETDGAWFTIDADGTRTEHPPLERKPARD